MERRLIVMRHARSSWAGVPGSDRHRPLDAEGRREAAEVGSILAVLGWPPDGVLASDARRTRETWEGMASALGTEVEPCFAHALYLAGIDPALEEVGRVRRQVVTLLLLGHNPDWEELIEWLTGSPIRLPTATAALLVGRGDTWASAVARPAKWTLDRVVRPSRESV
jgi:phosphohistidine phosphatase